MSENMHQVHIEDMRTNFALLERDRRMFSHLDNFPYVSEDGCQGQQIDSRFCHISEVNLSKPMSNTDKSDGSCRR